MSSKLSKKDIVKAIKTGVYGPKERTIYTMFPKDREKIFNDDSIRRLLQQDNIGSEEWYKKVDILAESGMAPKKTHLLALFGIDIKEQKRKRDENILKQAREIARELKIKIQQEEMQKQHIQQLLQQEKTKRHHGTVPNGRLPTEQPIAMRL